MTSLIRKSALVALLLGTVSHAQQESRQAHESLRQAQESQRQAQDQANAARDDFYQQGQAALRQQEYARAAEAFEQAQALNQRSDAAAYWHAYALFRAGRKRQAGAALRSMLRRYPQSEWVDDARALEAEMGTTEISPDAEEELRLFALYHLMEANPERGMALLRNMLQNTTSPATKRHLLFLLAGQDDAEVSREIVDLARSNADPELQVQAIHIIAASGNRDALKVLGELYASDSDQRVRRAIIDAHIAADAPQALAAIIAREPNLELKRQGIMALGAMDATAELKALYQQVREPGLRRALLEAFAISGDISELAGIIENETDPQIRAVAIRSLGIAGDTSSAELLEKMARSSTSGVEQKAILEALLMMDSGAAVAQTIFRQASDPQVMRQAVQTLAILDGTRQVIELYQQLENPTAEVQRAVLEALIMGEDGAEIAYKIALEASDHGVTAQAIQTLSVLAASAELRELYTHLEDEHLRRMVMQQIAMTEDADVLLQLLQKETDPQVRADSIRALSVHHAVEDADLVALYDNATLAEKRAVIDALMVQDADSALVELLEAETDVVLRKRLLQALMATGSELAEEYLFQWLEQAQ